MNINTTIPFNSHPKSIIETLQRTESLPFREVLSSEMINESLQDIRYRDRYNFYPPDVTLWAFLSQILDADHSLDTSVARVEVERSNYFDRPLLRTGLADFPHPAPESAKLFSGR